MRIQGNDSVIDKLLNGGDKVVYNLVSFIRGQNSAQLYTDGKSYLTAQANANCPMWVYVNPYADGQTEQELISIFAEAFQENHRFSVNAQEGFAEKALTLFSEQFGLTLTKRKPLNAYFIREVREVVPVGKMIASNEKYENDIALLIRQASVDDCDGDMTQDQAIQFAKAHSDTGNLYLWEQNGIVSMARVVRYGTAYARLTSIVTERGARGHGYAKMLVGELCKRLLKEGLTPVLYARSENESSNRCYRNLGFEKAGEICEFKIEK